MHSLPELQRGFMRALLDGEPDAALPLIASPIAPRQALAVYANTARSNFIDSLHASFPVIGRLVGADYFDHCARNFHAGHPSLSGDLQPAGAGFAQHLAQAHDADEYRYLGEVARLEWLIQETLLASDHPPFDPAKLQSVPPADYDDLHFQLHPSVRLFVSEFPCVAIWQANAGDAEPEVLDLRSGADNVLICRSRGELVFHPLSRSEHGFVESLSADQTFADAIVRGSEAGVDAGVGAGATAGGSEFDAAAALRRFVLAEVIVDFH